MNPKQETGLESLYTFEPVELLAPFSNWNKSNYFIILTWKNFLKIIEVQLETFLEIEYHKLHCRWCLILYTQQIQIVIIRTELKRQAKVPTPMKNEEKEPVQFTT